MMKPGAFTVPGRRPLVIGQILIEPVWPGGARANTHRWDARSAADTAEEVRSRRAAGKTGSTRPPLMALLGIPGVLIEIAT